LRAGYIFSGVLHGVILLLILLGLPDWFKDKPPEQQPIVVQLVNVSDLTRALQHNPHPVEQAKIDTPVPNNPSNAPADQKPDPLAPPPPPPAAAARQPDQDTDDSTPPPDQTKPAPQDDSTPPPPAPPKPSPAPPPKPKPTPPKKHAKPKAPKPVKIVKPKPVKKKAPKSNIDREFDSLLMNLADTPTPPDKTNEPPRHIYHPPPPQVASAQPDAPLGDQLTTSEEDAVIAQIKQCWNDPQGGKDEDQIVVPIKLVINPDGTVQQAQYDASTYNSSSPLWQAVADSAIRAVMNPACNPLKLPLDKYDTWKNTNLNFRPSELQ